MPHLQNAQDDCMLSETFTTIDDISSTSQAPNLVSLAKKTNAGGDEIVNDPFAINRQLSKQEEGLAPDLNPREIKRESLAAKSFFSAGKVAIMFTNILLH